MHMNAVKFLRHEKQYYISIAGIILCLTRVSLYSKMDDSGKSYVSPNEKPTVRL